MNEVNALQLQQASPRLIMFPATSATATARSLHTSIVCVGVRVVSPGSVSETCKSPRHSRASFHSWNWPYWWRATAACGTPVDCMFELSSFSTASRIKCIKYATLPASDVATKKAKLLLLLYRACSSLWGSRLSCRFGSSTKAGGAPAANCFAIITFC